MMEINDKVNIDIDHIDGGEVDIMWRRYEVDNVWIDGDGDGDGVDRDKEVDIDSSDNKVDIDIDHIDGS